MFTLFNKCPWPLEPSWLVIVGTLFFTIGIVKVHWFILLNLSLVTVLASAAQFVPEITEISLRHIAFVESMGWMMFFVSLFVSPKGKHPNSVFVTLKWMKPGFNRN